VIDKRLKRVSYDGFNPPSTRSEVVYMIQGNRIIFSATEDGVRKTTSTINAAEEIVQNICKAEGICWQDYVFYDVQTAIGYPHHNPDYLCVDELVIKDNGDNWMNVEQWKRVDLPDDITNPFLLLASGN